MEVPQRQASSVSVIRPGAIPIIDLSKRGGDSPMKGREGVRKFKMTTGKTNVQKENVIAVSFSLSLGSN